MRPDTTSAHGVDSLLKATKPTLPKQFLSLFFVLTLLVGGAAACGDDSGDDGGSDSTSGDTQVDQTGDADTDETGDTSVDQTGVADTDETQAVYDHHWAAVEAGDLDEIMADYTEDSVVISSGGGVVTGLEAIREFFAPTAGLFTYEFVVEHVEGEMAFVVWEAEGISLGTDTFVVRDGKIAAQTVVVQLG